MACRTMNYTARVSASLQMAPHYDPSDRRVLADPFPLYARLRDEEPAHWSSTLKAWVLTRYEDVKAACLDSGLSSDRLRPFFATLPASEGERSQIDFIADFAGPLPALVIMDMLGVPASELSRLKRLSDEMALFIGSARETPGKNSRAEAATR